MGGGTEAPPPSPDTSEEYGGGWVALGQGFVQEQGLGSGRPSRRNHEAEHPDCVVVSGGTRGGGGRWKKGGGKSKWVHTRPQWGEEVTRRSRPTSKCWCGCNSMCSCVLWITVSSSQREGTQACPSVSPEASPKRQACPALQD